MEETNSYHITDDAGMATEPALNVMSDSITKSGLLRQVMKLSRPDKMALIAYLQKDIDTEEPLKTDDQGQIVLSPEMKDAVSKAEQNLANGQCITEEAFRQRFSKWL